MARIPKRRSRRIPTRFESTADRWNGWISRSARTNDAFVRWMAIRVDDPLEGNWDSVDSFAAEILERSDLFPADA